jgi:site-specific DNA-methyltransferase (adenine-specific)
VTLLLPATTERPRGRLPSPSGAAIQLQPPVAGTLDYVWRMDVLTFLRALPDKAVDIVITSPPYNIRWKSVTSFGMLTGTKWIRDFRNGYDNSDDHMPEMEYQAWIRDIVTESLRVSKGLVWINHKTRYRDGVAIHPLQFMPFPLWSEVIWDQGQSRTLNSKRFAPSHEFFFGFGRPHYWDNKHNTRFTVWRVVPGATPDHPAPFPEAIIRPLIEASCPPGGAVCDPFMGSGTSGAVARQLGRHYVGCDNSSRYVEDARKRLSQAVTRALDTLAAPPVAVQQALALDGA